MAEDHLPLERELELRRPTTPDGHGGRRVTPEEIEAWVGEARRELEDEEEGSMTLNLYRLLLKTHLCYRHLHPEATNQLLERELEWAEAWFKADP